MPYIQAILVKYIMIASISWLTLFNFGSVSLVNLATISIVATILTFLIGDLIILPRTNSITAAIIDVPLLVAIFYGMQFLIPGIVVTFGSAVLASVIIGFLEWLIHYYFKRTILAN